MSKEAKKVLRGRGRGRPAFEDTNKGLALVLREIQSGNPVSRFIATKLVAKGLVDAVPVDTGKRGRPPIEYQLSGRGRGLLGLAASWKW